MSFIQFIDQNEYLNSFQLDIKLVQPHTYLVSKDLWDYQECLEFQKFCQDFVKNYPPTKILICTSHSPCFTYGRGIQKGTAAANYQLVETDFETADLPYPKYKINRGGGLTFHHPGQWIFYPIVHLNRQWNLKYHGQWMLNAVKSVLQLHFFVDYISCDHDLLGLWAGGKKIASIGYGANKFVTCHGLALNVKRNYQYNLDQTFPCGLSPNQYSSLDEVLQQEISPKKFHRAFTSMLPYILNQLPENCSINTSQFASISHEATL